MERIIEKIKNELENGKDVKITLKNSGVHFDKHYHTRYISSELEIYSYFKLLFKLEERIALNDFEEWKPPFTNSFTEKFFNTTIEKLQEYVVSNETFSSEPPNAFKSYIFVIRMRKKSNNL